MRPDAPGSSPLTRGKPMPARLRIAVLRLIPAHAGKTASSSRTSRARAAHPRSRGENMLGSGVGTGAGGSSPLTRGKPSQRSRAWASRRLIPAHAGKTTPTPGSPCRRGAHPRSRGENGVSPVVPTNHLGSSPLTRGKRGARSPQRRQAGLIPAHAGKTIPL